MKKQVMASIVLTLFVISILLFQISCKKEKITPAQSSNYTLSPATATTLEGVIVGNGLSVTPTGVLSVNTVPPTNLGILCSIRLSQIILQQRKCGRQSTMGPIRLRLTLHPPQILNSPGH